MLGDVRENRGSRAEQGPGQVVGGRADRGQGSLVVSKLADETVDLPGVAGPGQA